MLTLEQAHNAHLPTFETLPESPQAIQAILPDLSDRNAECFWRQERALPVYRVELVMSFESLTMLWSLLMLGEIAMGNGLGERGEYASYLHQLARAAGAGDIGITDARAMVVNALARIEAGASLKDAFYDAFDDLYQTDNDELAPSTAALTVELLADR